MPSEPTKAEREAFDKGAAAFHRGRSIRDAPYATVALMHAWQRGWKSQEATQPERAAD